MSYTFRDIFDVDHIPVPRIVPPQHETTNSKNKEIPNQPPEINNPFDESKPLNKEKEGTAISTELNIITKSSATKIYASPDVMLKKRHLKETSHYLNSLGMNSVNPKNSLTLSEKKSSLRNDGCSSTHAPESIYRPSGSLKNKALSNFNSNNDDIYISPRKPCCKKFICTICKSYDETDINSKCVIV